MTKSSFALQKQMVYHTVIRSLVMIKNFLAVIVLVFSLFWIASQAALAQTNSSWIVADNQYCKDTCKEGEYCTLQQDAQGKITGVYACQQSKTQIVAQNTQPQPTQQNSGGLLNAITSFFYTVTPTWIYEKEALTPDPETGQPPLSLASLQQTMTSNLFSQGVVVMGGGQVQNANGQTQASGGMIGVTGGLIGAMIEKSPASSVDYLADVGARAGIVKTAYAQGTGYYALQPVLPIWKAFRNVAYLGFILMFVVIGFMIMFRTKVNQQVVMTVQQAIPQIIITLILVTFSYAIAGFVIDLIYVAIYLFVGILALGGMFEDEGVKALSRVLDGNLFSIIFKGRNTIIANPAKAVGEITSNILNDFLNTGVNLGIVGTAVGALVQKVMELILLFAVLASIWKLFFVLLMAYIRIILNVIFSPIYILMNAMPGSDSFSSWLRNIVSDAAIFPVTAAMFIIAGILAGQGNYDFTGAIVSGVTGNVSGVVGNVGSNLTTDTNPWGVADGVGYLGGTYIGYQGGGGGWMPPMLAFGNAEDASANIVLGLLAIGMILLTPQVAKFTKEFIQAQENKYTPTIFEQIQGGWGMVASPVTTPWNIAKGPALTAGLQVWAQRGYPLPNPKKIGKMVSGVFGRGRNGGSSGSSSGRTTGDSSGVGL